MYSHMVEHAVAVGGAGVVVYSVRESGRRRGYAWVHVERYREECVKKQVVSSFESSLAFGACRVRARRPRVGAASLLAQPTT